MIVQVQTLLPQRRSFGFSRECMRASIHSAPLQRPWKSQSSIFNLPPYQFGELLFMTALGYRSDNWIHFIYSCRRFVDDLLMNGVAFVAFVVVFILVCVRACVMQM